MRFYEVSVNVDKEWKDALSQSFTAEKKMAISRLSNKFLDELDGNGCVLSHRPRQTRRWVCAYGATDFVPRISLGGFWKKLILYLPTLSLTRYQ